MSDIAEQMRDAYQQAFRAGMVHACACMAGLAERPLEREIGRQWPESAARALAERLEARQ